jgi:hypothetical protein
MDSELQDLVKRYRVTWETRPEMAPSGRSVHPIGTVIELSAVTDQASHKDAIECPECGAIEDALDRLITAVAPQEVRHVGRGERHLGGTGHDAHPEVNATVTVLHRDGGGANRPPTPDQQDRVAAISARLRELGAQQGHWH